MGVRHYHGRRLRLTKHLLTLGRQKTFLYVMWASEPTIIKWSARVDSAPRSTGGIG